MMEHFIPGLQGLINVSRSFLIYKMTVRRRSVASSSWSSLSEYIDSSSSPTSDPSSATLFVVYFFLLFGNSLYPHLVQFPPTAISDYPRVRIIGAFPYAEEMPTRPFQLPLSLHVSCIFLCPVPQVVAVAFHGQLSLLSLHYQIVYVYRRTDTAGQPCSRARRLQELCPLRTSFRRAGGAFSTSLFALNAFSRSTSAASPNA